MYSRILCPVDGSESSLAAATTAGRLAELYSAELTLLHVVDTPVLELLRYRSTMMEEDLLSPQLEERMTGRAHEILQEAGQAAGGTARTQTVAGHPVEAICEIAADYDLVVTGTRGLGRVGRLLLGSVSAQLVRECPVPVMVVRHP